MEVSDMGLGTKDFDINHINCDDYNLSDFAEFQSQDMFEVKEYFSKFLQDAIAKKYMVYGNPVMTAPSAEFDVYDRYQNVVRKFLNFCSYNYLGYSVHPEVIKTVQEALTKYGTGAVSAPLLSGFYDITKKLEEAIAQFKHKEAALVFPTGYGTNLGVLHCLLKPGDVAVLDVLSHASIYDGVKLAGADIKVFSHNNMKHLEKILKNLKNKRVIVCVEGVYSMHGDLADLPLVVPICKKYGAKILLDEAHSTLIFGENGRGVAEHFGVEDQIDLSIGTFSKSFGAIGGFVVGDLKLITYLRMFARAYVFSCAMAPYTAAGLLKVLELYQKDKSQRDTLWKNVRYMQDRLTVAGLDIGDTKSQVIPVICGSDHRLREISKRIQFKGLYTGYVTYPAVSNKRTRLRLSISSYHTKEQMDRCVSILKDVFEEMKTWKTDDK
jgi:8-amino-7-oxononanoate synthase